MAPLIKATAPTISENVKIVLSNHTWAKKLEPISGNRGTKTGSARQCSAHKLDTQMPSLSSFVGFSSIGVITLITTVLENVYANYSPETLYYNRLTKMRNVPTLNFDLIEMKID